MNLEMLGLIHLHIEASPMPRKRKVLPISLY